MSRKPPSPPPLGDRNLDVRACTRDTRWPQGIICGADPFLHVSWGPGETPCGFVCERHAAELNEKNWIPFQAHELGVDCGMPGAVWDENENRCYVPEDEAESAVEAAVPVAAAGGGT